MRVARLSFVSTALFCGLTVACWAAPADREDDSLDFLHLMQAEGFADISVEYLYGLKEQPNAPKEVVELWDLEMSRSKRAAAKLAYNETKGKQLLDEAKVHLDKFIKDHPNHPKAIQEAAVASEKLAEEAQYEILLADYITDKTQIAASLEKAHKLLDEVRPRFVKSLEVSEAEQKKLTPKSGQKKLVEARFLVGENRLTICMIDFYLAQSMKISNPAERTGRLGNLAKEFDDIFQKFRESDSLLEKRAHFWTGRVLQEQGKLKEAKDVYEEVSAADPANIQDSDSTNPNRLQIRAKTGLEPFFAEVEFSYLKALHTLAASEYLKETREWRVTHKQNSEAVAAYQAISFELAKDRKAAFDKGDKVAGKEALKILSEMAKIPSPYQAEAIKLRHVLNPTSSAEDVFEEELMAAQESIDAKKWSEAVEHYETAAKSAAKSKSATPERIKDIYNTIVQCKHHEAVELYKAKKVDDSIKLMRETMVSPIYRNTAAAPQAAQFLVTIQHFQYLSAPEKTAAEKQAKADLAAKTISTAEAIVKAWPTLKEVPDAARIIKLRVLIDQQKLKEADDLIKQIDPQSPDYAKSQFVVGFAHWHDYRLAKRDIEGGSKDAALKEKGDEHRKLALEYMKRSADALSASRQKDAPMPKELVDVLLQLADISAEGNDFKGAIFYYQPLIDDFGKRGSKALDETTLRLFTAAAKAYMQINDMTNAAKVGEKLLELGPDEATVNFSLMNFAKRLDVERRKLEDQLASGDDPAVREKQQSFSQLLEKIMTNLAGRTNVSAVGMVWMAKTCSQIGTDSMDTLAAEQVNKILERAKTDQDFSEQIKTARPGLQTLAITIQARRGKYNEAEKQADELVKEHPRALEPRITLATILQKEAEHAPEKYAEAISAWDFLRTKLERVPDKRSGGKMKEYYDALYNESFCFYSMAKKNNVKEDAKKGLALISPVLKLDPKIQGPKRDRELSSKFFALGDHLADFLGIEKPSKAAVAKPKPTEPSPPPDAAL